jgi:murein DD-endopeptidase MepM/ murein hydrolase activator NlpD
MPPAPPGQGCVARHVSNIARSWTTALVRPVPATDSFRYVPAVAPVGSTAMLAASDGIPFGVQRLYNGKPSGTYHGGVDQRSPAGRPVRAAADGVVKIVQAWNIHGGTVGIDHGQGLESMYLHMSRFAAKEGAAVKKGDVIGYVGSTGRSTAPHLHWSLYANGVPVDPRQWVPLKACAAGGAKRKR